MSQSGRLWLAAQQAAQGRGNDAHAHAASDYGRKSGSVRLDGAVFETP